MPKKTTITFITPAYNEELIIKESIEKLYPFLEKNFKKYNWKLIIAEHDSKDRTAEIGRMLEKKHKKLFLSQMDNVDKSTAIRGAWLKNEADILVYSDIDLSGGLEPFIRLVNLIESGEDIAICSRNLDKKGIKRDINREILSWFYNLLIKIIFDVKLTDFQCGLKAINNRTLNELITKMQFTSEGFMDTEYLIIGAKKDYKIKEIAVKWRDIRKTKFNIKKVTIQFLGNLFKLRRAIKRGDYN